MDRHRANQIERYVLFATGAGLLLLRVVLALTVAHPTRVQARMFTIVLMLAAGAFGGALPGAIAAEGTDPSAAAKAIGAIGSALAVALIYRWVL